MMYIKKRSIEYNRNFCDGTTFIELLLYIGIVSVVLLASGSIAMNVLYGKAKISAMEEVSQNGRFALEKIRSAIRNADSITAPILGGASSTLSLVMPSGASDPTVFSLSDGHIWMKQGAATEKVLTGNGVAITNMQFSNISYTDTPGTIRIRMEISSQNLGNRKEFEVQRTFYTTVNLKRNNEN